MYSPDIHRSGSSSSSRDTRRQPNQPAGIMPAQRKESQVDSIGQNLGLAPGSFKVHQNSEMAKGAGALAYAQGNDVHFAPGQFKPETQQGRELIGHELAHVAQQREGRVKANTQVNGMSVNNNPSLEKEADVLGAKAANGEAVQKKASGSQATGGEGVVQGYFQTEVGGEEHYISDDRTMVTKRQFPNHVFYMNSSKVADSNQKLNSVNSGIRLENTTESITIPGKYKWSSNITLSKVIPRRISDNLSGENMPLWADCGRSCGVVVGNQNRRARYKDPNRTRNNDTQTSISYPTEMKSEIMEVYLQKLKSGWIMPGTRTTITNILNDAGLIDTQISTSTNADEINMLIEQKAIKLFEYYNSLSGSKRDSIDKLLGINKYAKPDVGDGWTISTGGQTIPGHEDSTWNFHWAGVVAKSDDGKDRVSLENYSVSDYNRENKRWTFLMYGSNNGQSFHERHKDHGDHGNSPTTMVVTGQ